MVKELTFKIFRIKIDRLWSLNRGAMSSAQRKIRTDLKENDISLTKWQRIEEAS